MDPFGDVLATGVAGLPNSLVKGIQERYRRQVQGWEVDGDHPSGHWENSANNSTEEGEEEGEEESSGRYCTYRLFQVCLLGSVF